MMGKYEESYFQIGKTLKIDKTLYNSIEKQLSLICELNSVPDRRRKDVKPVIISAQSLAQPQQAQLSQLVLNNKRRNFAVKRTGTGQHHQSRIILVAPEIMTTPPTEVLGSETDLVDEEPEKIEEQQGII